MDTMPVIAGDVIETTEKELKIVGVENMEVMAVEEEEDAGEEEVVKTFDAATTDSAENIAKMVQPRRLPVVINTLITHLPLRTKGKLQKTTTTRVFIKVNTHHIDKLRWNNMDLWPR